MQDYRSNNFVRFINNSCLSFFIRILLGAIFVYASLDKIAHSEVFAINIRNYQMIPPSFTNLLAVILPWLELYCGLALIIGFYLRGSAVITAGMLIIFIIALASATVRGFDIDCGCYKTFEAVNTVGIRRIIEDIVMLLMAVQVFFADHSFLSLDRWLSGRAERRETLNG